MRKKYAIPFVIAGLIILAFSVRISIAASGHKSGPIQETPPPATLQYLIPQTPQSTPDPTTCGPWSSPDGSAGEPLSQKYGELRNCLLFDNSWIILTEGLVEPSGIRQSGVVAVYRCEPTDSTCLDGQTDHPFTGWQIYEPPCPGELSVGFNYLPGKLHIMGTCATFFDVATGTFSNN